MISAATRPVFSGKASRKALASPMKRSFTRLLQPKVWPQMQVMESQPAARRATNDDTMRGLVDTRYFGSAYIGYFPSPTPKNIHQPFRDRAMRLRISPPEIHNKECESGRHIVAARDMLKKPAKKKGITRQTKLHKFVP